MTERADQFHQDNFPAHSTVLVQAFGKALHHPGLSAPLQYRFGSLRLLAFSKAKIAVQKEEISKGDGHTVHKLSQRRLTADLLAPRESDCSRMHSKVSSDWLPSYIKATRPVLRYLTLRLLMSYIYMEHLFLMFLDHTQRRTTVGRTPLDE